MTDEQRKYVSNMLASFQVFNGVLSDYRKVIADQTITASRMALNGDKNATWEATMELFNTVRSLRNSLLEKCYDLDEEEENLRGVLTRGDLPFKDRVRAAIERYAVRASRRDRRDEEHDGSVQRRGL